MLGHECAGSVAYLLKKQGLLQELTVGVGDEVRLGAGFIFWKVDMELTEKGLDHAEHVVATVYRAIQVRAGQLVDRLLQL